MPTLSAETKASYYDWAKQGRVFIAYATTTSSVIWSTATGTGGPLLWNNSAAGLQSVRAVLLAVGASITTASGAASAIGITGATGQTAAPTTNTAIDGSTNCLIGGPASLCNVYRKGTVANAGVFFMPTHLIGTGAVTLAALGMTWVDLGGSIIVPPGSWASVACSATATSAVLDVGLMWAEIPLD